MTVMATTSILFVMATTLMMIVGFQQQATGLRVGRVRAMHVADAGINAYLYRLRNEYDTYMDHLDTGWVTVSGGEKYRVIVEPPANGKPLTLHSTGVAGDGTQTIAATVRFPTFADYMFLSDSNLSLAGDANVTGQVRSNGNVDNQGTVTGKIIAGGDFTGKSPSQGYLEHQPLVSFTAVGNDLERTLRPAAVAAGTLFPASGALGYRVVVNGSTVVIDKITGGIDTGDFVTEPVTSVSITTAGALYFEDTIWVAGKYSKPITIAAREGDKVGDIYLIDDFMPTTPDTTATAGLIAEANIIVPGWFGKDELTVQAAMLARTGHIYADIKQGFTRSRISIQGSLAYGLSGGEFGTVDPHGNPVSGFRQKYYTYDERLDLYPPPFYPVVMDKSLKIDTWVEDKNPVW